MKSKSLETMTFEELMQELKAATLEVGQWQAYIRAIEWRLRITMKKVQDKPKK